MVTRITIETPGQGLHDITDRLAQLVRQSGARQGLCTIIVQHTSASLIVQENADPSARRDLEAWMNRLVKENDSLYSHTSEGPDDMPSHIRAMLTAPTLSIPIENGSLALGRWQGIYLWEHRHKGRARECVVHVLAE